MRIKNLVLEDLKAHTWSDYQIDGIKKIKILVNPDADFLITLNSEDFYGSYSYEKDVEDVTETSTTEVFEGVEETVDGIEATTEVVYEGDILEE